MFYFDLEVNECLAVTYLRCRVFSTGSAGKRLNDLSGLKWVREQHVLRRAGTVSRAWRPRAWRAPHLSGFPHVISSPSAPSASPQGRDPEHPDDERGYSSRFHIFVLVLSFSYI